MKNITLSVDDDVLASVRRLAAERSSTVNAMVREYLSSLAVQESRANQATAELLELARKSKARLGRKTWRRDDLHAR